MSANLAEKTTYLSILSNLLIAVIKFLAGIFGHSYALIADATESLTDTFSSFLVLLGIKYAQKPADENHPYGHGKIEPLVTFLVVATLAVSAILIAFQAVKNILSPQQMPEPWTLIVLAAIILSKEITFQIVLRNSKITNSTSLKADAWHHRADALTSIAAFVGISVALLMGEGYEAADDWAALVAAGIIFYNAYKIFRPALGEIMDENLYDDLISKTTRLANQQKGVIGVEKCYVRKIGMSYCMDMHIIVNGRITVKDGHDIAHKVEDQIHTKINPYISVLIHIEPDFEDVTHIIKKSLS